MKALASYKVERENVPAEVVILDKPDEFVSIYELRHTRIKDATAAALTFLKEKIIESVNIKISEILDPRESERVKQRIITKAHELVQSELSGLGEDEENIIVGRLAQEMLGLGELELVLADDNLEEVVVNSSKEPVWVYHKKFGWLKTNVVIPSEEQIHNYASIIGRRVGRQITNLDPLMDAHLITGDRVNATLFPISTKGNSITIRKFAKDPWTIMSLIANNTLSIETAALIWLSLQYELSVLVGGGTASGKTSMLNSILVFTPPNQRVVSIEDSVGGESVLLFEEDGELKRSSISEFVDGMLDKEKTILRDGAEVHANQENIKVFCMDKEGKIRLAQPSSFIRHYVKKKMLEITTATGRRISVTRDHSLFSLVENEIKPVAGREIKLGARIAVPRNIPYTGNRKTFDLFEYLPLLKGFFLKGSSRFKWLLKENRSLLREYCNKFTAQYYARTGVLPVELAMKIGWLPEEVMAEIVLVPARSGRSPRVVLPMRIEFDNELAEFCGLWLSDGSFDKNSIIVSVVDDASRNVVRAIATRFGTTARMHSDGFSLMICSKALKTLVQKIFGFDGNAYTKRVPAWVYGCDDETIAALLRGYFSGDAWVKQYEVATRSASLDLIKDLQTLLLRFGVVLRFREKRLEDKTFEARISGNQFLNSFRNAVCLLPLHKQKKLEKICLLSRHDVSDTVPLQKEVSSHAEKHIGRSTLQKMLSVSKKDSQLAQQLERLASSDLLWDEVIDVSEKDFEGFVYDLSVPGNESFICENIVAHNTRELVLPEFVHWTPMSTRQPNPEGKGGVEMLDLMVNSLRMRPDRIVLGEIRRQREAEVLFEAMHTGHSVYSTLHADDAAQVRQRLISPPINLPESVIGALQLILVQYRQRRSGIRRSYEIAEVLQSEEGVNINVLYKWDARDDTLRKVGDYLRLTNDLVLHTGMTQKEITDDLEEKKTVIKGMAEKQITKVNDVGRIVANYYRDSEAVSELARKGQLVKLLIA